MKTDAPAGRNEEEEDAPDTMPRRPSHAGVLIAALIFLGCGGTPPADLGEVGSVLRACPPSPNCVSSDSRDEHFVAPIEIVGPPQVAFAKARDVVASWSRTTIDRDEPGYLHAECTSLVLRFNDDLELVLREPAGVIAVRSASRLGYSDFGANRRRVEKLRRALVAEGVAAPTSAAGSTEP